MSLRMMKINLSLLMEKIKMKYITHEMVNEDIFPLCGKRLPEAKWTKEQVYKFLEG